MTRNLLAQNRRLLQSVALVFYPLVIVILTHGAGTMSTWAFAAFMMGILIELLRLATRPRDALFALTLALGLSVLFLFRDPDRWPLYYAVSLSIAIVFIYQRRLTARIGEGSALLASLAFMAWMLDRYIHEGASAIPLALSALPLAYTLTLALTNARLTPGHRLAISLWSALVLVALSIRYVQDVLALGSVEERIASGNPSGAISVFAEFLLLGASGPVLAQNALMLIGYIPDQRTLVRNDWREFNRDTTQLSHDHIARVSTGQVSGPQVVVVLLIATALLFARKFEMLSIGFVVWFLLTGVPWVMNAWNGWTRIRSAGDAARSQLVPASPSDLERRCREIHELALQVERHESDDQAGSWIARLRDHVEEIEPSAEAFVRSGRPDLALDLIGALSTFWQETGEVGRGRAMTESIIGKAGERSTREAARAQLALGELAFRQGDQTDAREATAKAQALAEQCGDAEVVGRGELNLARVAFRDQNARQIFQHAERLLQLAGDNLTLKSGAIRMLGWAEHTAGNLPAAMDRFEENVTLLRKSGNHAGEAGDLANLADLSMEIGALEKAADYLRDAFAIRGATESRYLLPSLIRSVASLAGLEGRHERALELMEASNRLYEESGLTPDPGDTLSARVRKHALAALGVMAATEHEERGGEMTREQAIAAALDALIAKKRSGSDESPGSASP